MQMERSAEPDVAEGAGVREIGWIERGAAFSPLTQSLSARMLWSHVAKSEKLFQFSDDKRVRHELQE